MHRRQFMHRAAATAAVAAVPLAATARPPAGPAHYEWRTYALRGGAGRQTVDNYLKDALAPALARFGGLLGAYTELGQPEPPRLHVLLTYPSAAVWLEAADRLQRDADYQRAAAAYHALPVSQTAFDRYDAALLRAFAGLPQGKAAPAGATLYELRTYEGYSEDAVRRKVTMFNDEELPLFERVGLHPVIFAERLVGPNLPALTYLLAFRDMAQRDAHWKQFVDHPDWKRMSADPRYADSVSRVNRTFLVPTRYSAV